MNISLIITDPTIDLLNLSLLLLFICSAKMPLGNIRAYQFRP